MTMEEFTKLTGYSPITVAQAVLYRKNRRPAVMAETMGLVYERSDLVRLAAPRKPKNKHEANTKEGESHAV